MIHKIRSIDHFLTPRNYVSQLNWIQEKQALNMIKSNTVVWEMFEDYSQVRWGINVINQQHFKQFLHDQELDKEESQYLLYFQSKGKYLRFGMFCDVIMHIANSLYLEGDSKANFEWFSERHLHQSPMKKDIMQPKKDVTYYINEYEEICHKYETALTIVHKFNTTSSMSQWVSP